MSEPTLTPEVLWAQRSSTSDPEKNHIFLTIVVPDVPKDDMKLDIQPTTLTLTGKSAKKCTYHVELPFYAEIDPDKSKIQHTDRYLELVLCKKELKEEYWPRLLKESKKMHFLKTDFDKWVDEDEQDAAPEDDDYMSRMAGMGGGAGADGGFGGIDFSKLGAGAGGDMPGMGGMGGMPGMGEDDDDDELPDDDDDEMPALEGEEDAATGAGAEPATAEGKGKAKIEEVE